MQLTHHKFERAKAFLTKKGRLLEQCLFRWVFENAPPNHVLDVLAQHQHASGGFWGMGEGSNQFPSPMGTAVAFKHLVDVDAKPTEDIVERGINYFINTYNQQYEAWPQIIPDDGYFKESALFWGNPGAEILGYLWKYKELVPNDFLAHVTDVAMSYFRGIKGPVPTFVDLCFLRCTRYIDPQYVPEIISKLIDTVQNHNLERDHSAWPSTYFVKPYWYATTPDSPLFSVLAEEVEACLDFDIQTQEKDGSAFLTFPAEGEDLNIWKSIWTLESLRVLKAYDKIEGIKK